MRWLAASASATSLLSLLIAYFFMQRYLLLEPCPLCILDRFVVAAMGLGFLVIAVVPERRRLVWAASIWNVLALAAGFLFAGRHIWLQNRPPDVSAVCLSDAVGAQDLVELIRRAFDAKADCGAILWEFAGLSIPEQVLLLFLALAAVQLSVFFLLRR